jgi:hypothetical protein
LTHFFSIHIQLISIAVFLALLLVQSETQQVVTTDPPTTEGEDPTTTTTPIPTTQDPLEARYILCQVMCQEQFVACTTDTHDIYYRNSVALNPDRPENARSHRDVTCGHRKTGCREKCDWLIEQTHMYNRNCTATNFLAGLDFNKPGFSLREELKTLKYITL